MLVENEIEIRLENLEEKVEANFKILANQIKTICDTAQFRRLKNVRDIRNDIKELREGLKKVDNKVDNFKEEINKKLNKLESDFSNYKEESTQRFNNLENSVKC